jgi:hypothetical protein
LKMSVELLKWKRWNQSIKILLKRNIELFACPRW